MGLTSRSCETIGADAYPAVMRRVDAQAFVKWMKSEECHSRAARVIAGRKSELCEAVRQAVARLDSAARAGDMDAVYAEAHEIRGVAHTGGLPASGRIADGLCLYLDAVARADLPVDGGIVGLHVGAIARAAHAEDEATRLGSEVADELSALVKRKLGAVAPQIFR